MFNSMGITPPTLHTEGKKQERESFVECPASDVACNKSISVYSIH